MRTTVKNIFRRARETARPEAERRDADGRGPGPDGDAPGPAAGRGRGAGAARRGRKPSPRRAAPAAAGRRRARACVPSVTPPAYYSYYVSISALFTHVMCGHTSHTWCDGRGRSSDSTHDSSPEPPSPPSVRSLRALPRSPRASLLAARFLARRALPRSPTLPSARACPVCQDVQSPHTASHVTEAIPPSPPRPVAQTCPRHYSPGPATRKHYNTHGRRAGAPCLPLSHSQTCRRDGVAE